MNSKNRPHGRHLCHVFTYIHSLLIEKDGCDRQNISIKFPCVFVFAFPTVISSIFAKSFPFPFPYFLNSEYN